MKLKNHYYNMQNLEESLGQMKSLSASINPVLERYNSTDERVFWQWIKDLGEEDAIDEIMGSKKSDYDKFYKLVSDLGTTADEFAKFSEIFYDKANEMQEIIENDEDAGLSDDGIEYASWSSPFYGKKKYDEAINLEDWQEVCDERTGEHCGYAMEDDEYEDWLEKNKIEPKGYVK